MSSMGNFHFDNIANLQNIIASKTEFESPKVELDGDWLERWIFLCSDFSIGKLGFQRVMTDFHGKTNFSKSIGWQVLLHERNENFPKWLLAKVMLKPQRE